MIRQDPFICKIEYLQKLNIAAGKLLKMIGYLYIV